MRTEKEVRQRTLEYRGVEYLYTPYGYVAWQMGTGDNVEIMFIEVEEKGKGHGANLLREMCKRIKTFHTVYVFRLASNESAGHFYRKMGFKEYPVPGIYKGEDAVIGIVTYNDLCQNLGSQ